MTHRAYRRQLDKSEPHQGEGQEGGGKEVGGQGHFKIKEKSLNNPHPKKRLDHWKHKKTTPGRVCLFPAAKSFHM